MFYSQLLAADDLEQKAIEIYRFFVGGLWERYGEDAWMGPWHEVYARPYGTAPDIVAELRGIKDPDAAVSVPMILDNLDNADQACAALAVVYDAFTLTDLRVYALGDGGAMSGLLVAGCHDSTREAIFLVFLLD
ncbi:MAG: hypothetical protein KC441_10840 [Anaerolineales bacterium]|nr:hypothetical protein [Anaerolineales bacterium]